MATATTLVKAEDNGMNNNNNNNNNYEALITNTQQLAQQFKQLQLEHEQHQQQQQQQQQQHQQQFEPFDFANLRRLHLKYKNGQQQRQQQQQQHIGQLNNNNRQRSDQDNYYSYSIDNNNNNNNYKNMKPNGNGYAPRNNNDAAAHDDQVFIHTIADARGGSTADVDDDDAYEHQDARNGFRLQLSAPNEPFRNTGSSDGGGDGGGDGEHIMGVSAGDSNNNNNSNNISKNKKTNNGYAATLSHNKSNKENSNAQDTDLFFGDMDFYNDEEENLPYGIQNVKRSTRKNLEHGGVTTYQSLCPTKRSSIPLETASYEYRPNHYIEVTCAHNYGPTHAPEDYNKNRICSEAGFACIQLNRTIHLIRRNKASVIDCWESEIRIVPSGCECMWPKHHYGDIFTYHQESKRQDSRSITVPVAQKKSGDTIVGVGELGHVEDGDYLEIPIEMIVDEQGNERPKERIIFEK